LVALLSLSPGLEIAGSTPLALTFNDLRPGKNETFGISPVVAISAEDGRQLWVEVAIDYTDQSGQPLGHQDLTVRMTVGAPRMSVGKTALDASPAPGEPVTFRIEYRNDGSAPDPEVWLREQPPAGLSFVSSSIPQQGNLSWRFGDVRPGSNSFTVTFQVDDVVAVGASLTNMVMLEGSFGRNSTAVANITISPAQVIDIYPPAVMLFSPGNGRTDVATGADIEVLFSEPMNRSSAESAFTLSPNVRGTFSWDGNRMKFHPVSPLAQGTQYTVKVAATATDAAGNPLGTTVSSSFTTTGMAPDLTAAAFTLAIILIAVVVGETVYLVNQRRKWASGKGPAAAPSGPPAPQASGEEPAAPTSVETAADAEAPAEQPASETAIAYQQKAGMGIPSASMETAMGPAPVWEPEEREQRSASDVELVRAPPSAPEQGAPSKPRGMPLMPPPSRPKAEAAAKPKEDDLDDILQHAMEALK
jgi:uncharacterized repeat protein (TIGR01451 family)